MARQQTRRVRRSRKAGAVAPRPDYGTSSFGTLRKVVGQTNFDRDLGPAPAISKEAQDERDVKQKVGELRAERRLTKTPQDEFVPSGDLKTMSAINPLFKAGRKTRKNRKSKKVSRRR